MEFQQQTGGDHLLYEQTADYRVSCGNSMQMLTDVFKI